MENKKNSLDINRVFKANKKDKLISAFIVVAVVAVLISLIAVFKGSIDVGINDPDEGGFVTVEFFKIIFGGILIVDEYGTNFTFSPLLLSAFILAVVALLLTIIIYVHHKTLLLNKKVFVALTVIAILFFVVAGTAFLFKEYTIKNQCLKAEMPEEMLNLLVVGRCSASMIFLGCQYLAAVSLIATLIAELGMKY